MRKKWEFCSVDREKALSLAQECEIAPFTALLLCSRGVEDVRSVKDFLSPGEALADPFSLKDMDKAVRRVADAVDRGERICVFGDYDADGVTAVSVLFSYLETLGADVYYRIPSRSDGYGLNAAAVEELAEQGVSLIITVDNGITAFDAAERAAELGVSLCRRETVCRRRTRWSILTGRTTIPLWSASPASAWHLSWSAGSSARTMIRCWRSILSMLRSGPWRISFP